MQVQVTSVKLQGRENKKEREVSFTAHTVNGVVILWKNATNYMDIQLQIGKEADQGHIKVPTMLRQMLKNQKNVQLLLYLHCLA